MRFFNTSGPVVAEDHYCIPALGAAEPHRSAPAHPRQTLLRPVRAAADGQDIGPAGAARPAQFRGGLSLRVRQH